MRKLYAWNTSKGPIFIAEREGPYLVLFDDENLSRYATAKQAAIAAAGGECDRAGPESTPRSSGFRKISTNGGA